MMTESMREIRLPVDLCRAVEERFGQRFGGLEEIVAFILGELVRDDATQMDQEEVRIIEERLRDLGYV
jgi:hypothetical protein